MAPRWGAVRSAMPVRFQPPRSIRSGVLLPVLVLAAAVLAAYWPALHAGWIWDDDSYVLENAVVRVPGELWRAWVPGATPQWYPLVFLSFGVQHAVHGIDPFGYHLVNVLLHLGSAVLAWWLLAALRLPGALLAAALFALHPVQVESVAWVTERKNVLSMAFALASMLAWVRWLQAGQAGGRRGWWLAMTLFACAMLSKTTAVAVPVAMAAAAWWRPSAGRTGRSVARAVMPFFAVGIVLGLATEWIEATHVGARGAEFERGAVERILQAAQAWWAYLGLWAWPADLMFVYPRFGGPPWSAWAALAGGIAVAGACAVAARRGARGPMAAFLVYSAGVFPALGFINLFPLRFAPIADHFLYVGTVPLAAGTAWLAAWAWGPLARRGLRPALGAVAAAALCAPLAALSHGHCTAYRDEVSLWRVALDRNPDAWLAANNLARILMKQSEDLAVAGDRAGSESALAEAATLVERAAALAGTIDMPVQSNLSEVRRLQGRLPEALAAIDAGIAIQPAAPGPHWQRGRLLEMLGRFAEAGPEYARAVEGSPRELVYLRELVRWQAKAGRLPEARATAERIVSIDPDDAEAVANLGALAVEQGDLAAGRALLRRAIGLADRQLAVTISVRFVRALLAPPTEPALAAEAARVATALAALSGGSDPIALVLLARAQAASGDLAGARRTLAAADAVLPSAPPEVREALAPDRAAIEALLR